MTGHCLNCDRATKRWHKPSGVTCVKGAAKGSVSAMGQRKKEVPTFDFLGTGPLGLADARKIGMGSTRSFVFATETAGATYVVQRVPNSSRYRLLGWICAGPMPRTAAEKAQWRPRVLLDGFDWETLALAVIRTGEIEFNGPTAWYPKSLSVAESKGFVFASFPKGTTFGRILRTMDREFARREKAQAAGKDIRPWQS